MARIGVAYYASDLQDLIPRRHPRFIGLTFGKNPNDAGEEEGLQFPFNPRIAQIFSSGGSFRENFVEIPEDRTKICYYDDAARTFDTADELDRDEIHPDEDFFDFIGSSDPPDPEFGFAFFDKSVLEVIIGLSDEKVLLSISKIQPGIGVLDYGGDTQYYTFKLEVDVVEPAAADIGLPEFAFGLPCPPYWSR